MEILRFKKINKQDFSTSLFEILLYFTNNPLEFRNFGVFFPPQVLSGVHTSQSLFTLQCIFSALIFHFSFSPLLLQSPCLKHLLLPPPLLFQICPLGFSCQHLSLSYSSCQYSFFIHPQVFLFTLSLWNWAVFSPVHQDTGIFLCWFFIAKFHTNILMLSEIILRTPVMLRTALIFNKFSNQPLCNQFYIIYSAIFPNFLSWLHTV